MFTKLALINFLSWENLLFEFPEGVTLFEGFNHDDNSPEGCGKSAILNGLSWVAYGQIPKDVKVNQIVKEGTKRAEGLLNLLTGHTIIRGRGKNTGTLQLFLPDGKEYIGKDINATQKYIDEIIGMTYETFLQSVYFAQNYGVKFITSDEKLRVQVLSDIADLSIFDKATKETTALMKVEKENKVSLEAEFKEYDYKIKEKEGLLVQLDTYKEDAKLERLSKIKKLDSEFGEYTKELDELTKFLKENTEEVLAEYLATTNTEMRFQDDKIQKLTVELGSTDTVKAEMKGLDKEIEAKMSNYRNLERELKLKEIGKGRIETRFSELEPKVDSSIDTLRVSFAKLEGKITKLQNPEAQSCPTCGTALAELEAGHFDKEIGELMKEQEANQEQEQELIKQFEADVVRLDSEIADMSTQIEEVKKSMDESEEQAKELQAELDCITLPDLSKVSAALEEARTERVELGNSIIEIGSLKKDIEKSSSELLKVEGKMTSIAGELDELETQKITKFDKDIKKTKEEKNQLVGEIESLEGLILNSKQSLSELTSLREGFKETKSYTFKALLRDLTNKSNFYLGQLFDLPIKIEFTNETEAGGVAKITDIVTIENSERPFALYSGGQSRRIQLAVDLALSDIVSERGDKPVKLLILDEYFKDLSENSMEKVLELLEGLDKSVLLIEHNSLIKNVVANTFEIELRNGTSKCL